MSDIVDKRYLKALIYTISNIEYPDKIYVGSTINLDDRIPQHYRDCKKCPNMLVYKFVNNDWKNWKFSIYEYYPCNNKSELTKREGEIIKEIGTLNERIAGRNKKQYYKDKLDIILVNKKQFYIKNKDKILVDRKQYYNDNKDRILEQKKDYYIKKKLLKNSKTEDIDDLDKTEEEAE